MADRTQAKAPARLSPEAPTRLSPEALERLLEVTRSLAAPLALRELLGTVTAAACAVLQAERCSVWLHDAARAELVLKVASDLQDVRLPLSAGLIGLCARTRRLVNVPDCYADPRFDRAMDQRTGFRTRCSLTLPLLEPGVGLVGVMQLLNRRSGVFDTGDERLAEALAAQCAVALQRARLTEALVAGERARQELEVARSVQMSTLPSAMPALAGYDCHGLALPAAQTGGDTFDLALVDAGLLVVLADATGHGIGPALSVTQMHAMLRMALRLGAPLERAVLELNNQLAQTLAEDRFITAFIGLLDPETHHLSYLSAGQAPILVRHADGRWSEHRPTGFPLGAMELPRSRPPVTLALEPGGLLVLCSDGLFDQLNEGGVAWGVERLRALVEARLGRGMKALAESLLASVQAHATGVEQADDITIVLLRRDPLPVQRSFARGIDALPELFAFSAGFCAAAACSDDLRRRLDFVLEELFTNVVKYGGGQAEPVVGLAAQAGVVEGWIEDPDGSGLDPRQSPDVDTTLPATQRNPGGLGLHLIKRLADSIDHRGAVAGRGSRTGFKMSERPDTEEGHAGH